MELHEIREKLKEMYGGENKPITDGHYDESLAVKCINGTFVGRKTENITVFRGIPYVGKQPVGELRWKAPVDVVPNDGVYEAYYNAKSAYGNPGFEVGSPITSPSPTHNWRYRLSRHPANAGPSTS